MGRESAFTYEEVAAAADAANAAGIKPTTRGIRERLGNIGSMGTINKLLQRWKANQDFMVAPALVLPAPLQRSILEFMDQELSKTRAGLEAELVECQQEMADLANENERQAEVIRSQEAQMERMATEKAAAEGRAAQLDADLETAREDAGRERRSAESVRTELAKAELRIEASAKIEADLTELRATLEKERGSRIHFEQVAAVLTAQKTDLEQRLADWKGQVAQVGDQIVKVQERADRLATSLDHERAQRIEAERESAVLKSQRVELDTRLSEHAKKSAVVRD